MNYWIVKGHNHGEGWANELQKNITPDSKWDWKTKRHNRVRELVKGDRVLFWECSPGSRFVGLGEIEVPFLRKNTRGESEFRIVTVTDYLQKTLSKSDLVEMPELSDAAFLKRGAADAFLSLRPSEARAVFAGLARLNPALRALWPDLLGAGITREQPAGEELVSDEVEAVEGRTKLAEHLRRERKPELAELKKQEVLRRCGRLECEVCGFDFEVFYGVVGHGFSEAHHLVPLAELEEERPTKLSDLAIVCANCHRMLHRHSPPMPLQELRLQVRK